MEHLLIDLLVVISFFSFMFFIIPIILHSKVCILLKLVFFEQISVMTLVHSTVVKVLLNFILFVEDICLVVMIMVVSLVKGWRLRSVRGPSRIVTSLIKRFGLPSGLLGVSER
jgi:hypothetical protein